MAAAALMNDVHGRQGRWQHWQAGQSRAGPGSNLKSASGSKGETSKLMCCGRGESLTLCGGALTRITVNERESCVGPAPICHLWFVTTRELRLVSFPSLS
jgi:hypothetical protein